MSNRNLRRLAVKHNAAGLAHVIQGLKTMSGALESTIPEAKQELEAALETLVVLRSSFSDVLYQMDRQRAVFLRMLHNMVVPSSDGDISELLACEAEYGAEYDAMRFLVWVAMLGHGEGQ